MTFDQVLVKMRGDSSRRFRRESWGVFKTRYEPRGVAGEPYVACDGGQLSGYDIAADDWIEVEA